MSASSASKWRRPANRDLLDILLESEAAAVASGISIAAVPPHAEPVKAPEVTVERRAAPTNANKESAAENILRVDAARIDNVMNLVGELIIGKSMLSRTILEFEKAHAKDPLRGKFADALAFQARVLNELQKSVMKIRMVPVEQLFRRFPRVVRDVAKETKQRYCSRSGRPDHRSRQGHSRCSSRTARASRSQRR